MLAEDVFVSSPHSKIKNESPALLRYLFGKIQVFHSANFRLCAIAQIRSDIGLDTANMQLLSQIYRTITSLHVVSPFIRTSINQ